MDGTTLVVREDWIRGKSMECVCDDGKKRKVKIIGLQGLKAKGGGVKAR
jgi:hypothetical protein